MDTEAKDKQLNQMQLEAARPYGGVRREKGTWSFRYSLREIDGRDTTDLHFLNAPTVRSLFHGFPAESFSIPHG